MVDPVTEKIWRVREQLIERAGGFDAYFDQLMKLDRKRLAAEAAKKKTKRALTGEKKRAPSRKAATKKSKSR